MTVIYKRQSWKTPPRVAFKCRPFVYTWCKTLADAVSLHTSSFLVVTLVSLVLKPVAGMALWFLQTLCQCKDCMVCVFLCSRKREWSIEAEENSLLCARKTNVELIIELTQWPTVQSAFQCPTKSCFSNHLFRPQITKANHHKSVWVYMTHDDQT